MEIKFNKRTDINVIVNSFFGEQHLGVIELQNDVWVPKSIELMPQAEYYVHLWCDWFNDEKNLNFEENPYEEYVCVCIKPNLTLNNKYMYVFGYMYCSNKDVYTFDDNMGCIQLPYKHIQFCHQQAALITKRLKDFWK
ncbi:MAG: hypothetical protein EKK64_03930 [Neisseriaceae bacterium]|nr:MAG: hypothetical protein EKK64_03930 [Neisseriaceae bacterium]